MAAAPVPIDSNDFAAILIIRQALKRKPTKHHRKASLPYILRMHKTMVHFNLWSMNWRNRSKSTLPLPGVIRSMFGDRQTVAVDEQKKHGGRVRSFPHLEGNWASYVYIPVTPDERLKTFVALLLQCLQPLNFEQMDDFHISLSRTVCIRHHWIQPLTESLKEKFQHLDSSLCDITALKLYTNDEKTRTFASLEMNLEGTNLLEYISAVDSCFQDFNLPPFYNNPSFHISLVWSVGDVISQISEKTKHKLQMLTKEFLSTHVDLSIVAVNQVYLKTGNKLFTFQLRNGDL